MVTKQILLRCNSRLMATHLRKFKDNFDDDDRIKWYATYNPEPTTDMESILGVHKIEPNCIFAADWDLFVSADHVLSSWQPDKGSPPLLMTGHGGQGKTFGGGQPYGFRRSSILDITGKSKYACIFETRESDRLAVIKLVPELKNIVKTVGSWQYDEIQEKAKNRAGYRKGFGFNGKDRVIFVISSWGKDCLLNQMGGPLIEECIDLSGKYKFIFSVHPNEYKDCGDGQRVWGNELQKLRKYGILVREPEEDIAPYLVASDVVICDHSSVSQQAGLLEKRMIFPPIKPCLIWSESVTRKLIDISPTMNRPEDLDELLRFPPQRGAVDRHEIAKQINPTPGEYATRARKEVYRLLKLKG